MLVISVPLVRLLPILQVSSVQRVIIVQKDRELTQLVRLELFRTRQEILM
jgi:hypothetical protein